MPGWSLDLTLNDPETGRPWDFSLHQVREKVRKMIRDTKPFLVICSPPCTMFSSLQNLSKNKRDQGEWQRLMKIAEQHIKFCVEIYKSQIAGRRFFLHEHPHSASSWQMKEIKEMMMHEEVEVTECDMCAYGLVVADKDGTALARKRTRLMSNSPEIMKRCSRQCSNGNAAVESGERLRAPTDETAMSKLRKGAKKMDARSQEFHRHADLTGGRARFAQVYPKEFCRAVCAGVAAQKRLYSLGLQALPLMSAEEIRKEDPSSELHEDGCETVAWDDQSGAELKPDMVRSARKEEIKYFKEMGVYEKVDVDQCWNETGKGPVGVRWVDINKGDDKNPLYRSRLVAKEYNDCVRPDLYAATPRVSA